MREVTGNLWEYPAEVRVITTNGTVKKNGECVMGRGCAAEAKQKFPKIPKMLGEHLQAHGNTVVCLTELPDGVRLFTFPVKHNWFEKADIGLITQSAKDLVRNCADFTKIVLPRPGCGNGGLKWEYVKPILEPILDDRFHVITFGNKK